MAFARRTLQNLFVLVRYLARQYSQQHVKQLWPRDYCDLLQELLSERALDDDRYVNAVVDALMVQGQAFRLIRLTVRVVRNLAIAELINAGDFWDRGPRGDRVVDYLMHQPNVAITWGNHDAAWMGACLGQEALIAIPTPHPAQIRPWTDALSASAAWFGNSGPFARPAAFVERKSVQHR